MVADSSFNVQRWLEAIGASSYTAAFTGHGCVNYERCVNLSEEDAHAVVKNDDDARLLMDRIKALRQFTEEDAVKLLSVSTLNMCTVCINWQLLFGPLVHRHVCGLVGAGVIKFWGCQASIMLPPLSCTH